ncbi:GNAT family N-acetyltransferase [Streptomyces sp. FH025]|uniref:GNAT family N-acetyltransferase n=1 Tax=Streptomyces sp. FH025 TaxID=2815937 RepID=UPI001A9F0374|nr:GNAT family protein [Streptomyces sp. FH025]MBO1419317.1 GNAT family N-acetyltransferase [Streptomyces sp. FH025]
MLIDHWPLRGLRITTPRLELRMPGEDDLAELAEVAARGVHPPDVRPFLTPWAELPPAERARHVLQMHWRRLGRWTPQHWALDLTVFHEGHPVGVQDMRAQDFTARREIASGSWLGLAHQGLGLGTEMRAAMLHLAFAGLDAVSATSMSFTDNHASLAVSRKLGYRPDGISRDVMDGHTVVSQRLRLSREHWQGPPAPVTVRGLTPACRELFGADAPPE